MAKRNPFAAIARGHDLAEAIVDAIREPLLVLGPDLRVIAASRSFYRTFAVTPRKTEGRLVFDLGDGQWNIPKLRALLEDIIPKRRDGPVPPRLRPTNFPLDIRPSRDAGQRPPRCSTRMVQPRPFCWPLRTSLCVERLIVKKMNSFKQRKSCFRRCNTALPRQIIASILLLKAGPCIGRKRVCTFRMPISASCRWQRSRSSCMLLG